MAEFKKNDIQDGKPDWSLFPFEGAELVVRVLEYGAKKYERDNWRTGSAPENRRRILTAACRHIFALFRGETVDEESCLPHVAHAACCLLFLCTFHTQGDDYVR